MSDRKLFWFVALISATVATSGCGSSSSSSSGGASMDQLAGQVDAQKAAQKQQEDAAAASAAAKAEADKKAADAAAAQAQAAAEKKKVGGRPAPEGGGYYSAIIGARRHVMNVVDAISWIQGVRNFQGTYGRNPKDTKEFMNVCVKENDLQLPKIEEDEEFLYDPKGESDGNFGQLYVVKKQTAESSPPANGQTPGSNPGPSGTPAPK